VPPHGGCLPPRRYHEPLPEPSPPLLAFTRYSFTLNLLCTSQSFVYPPLFCPHCCKTIARPLSNARPPPTPLLYALHHTLLVMTISYKGQLLCASSQALRRAPSVPPHGGCLSPRRYHEPLPVLSPPLLTFTRYSFTFNILCTSQSFVYPPPVLPTLLQDHCTAINARPPPTPLLYAIHHTLLVMTISCKGQVPPPCTEPLPARAPSVTLTLALTRYCHHQYRMIHGIQKGGR